LSLAWYRAVVVLLLAFSISSSESASNGEVDVERELLLIKHNTSGWSNDLKAYQIELMTTIFAMSEEKYGPYTLEFVNRYMSTIRSMIASERGEIHTGLSSGWGIREENMNKVDLHLRPYIKTLLGLRRCIIRREDAEAFASIRTLFDLAKFKAGQGEAWPDSRIYRHYGISVVDSNSLSNLFPMLQKKRFDFIPLSVLEVDGALEAVKNDYPDLIVAEGLYIFYPIPVYISSSRAIPEVSERIRYGLELLYGEDSRTTRDDMLYRHFPMAKNLKITEDEVLLILDNPYIGEEANDSTKQYFRSLYR